MSFARCKTALLLQRKLHQIFCATSASTSTSRPDLDFDYLLDKGNEEEISENIKNRKATADLQKIHSLWERIHWSLEGLGDKKGTNNGVCVDENQLQSMWDELYAEAKKFPNKTHPRSPKVGEPFQVDEIGMAAKAELDSAMTLFGSDSPKTAEDILRHFKTLRAGQISSGERSWNLTDGAAELEAAVQMLAFSRAVEAGFTPVYVPDILPADVPAACGIVQKSHHPIIYKINQREQPKQQQQLQQQRDPPSNEKRCDEQGDLQRLLKRVETLMADQMPNQLIDLEKLKRHSSSVEDFLPAVRTLFNNLNQLRNERIKKYLDIELELVKLQQQQQQQQQERQEHFQHQHRLLEIQQRFQQSLHADWPVSQKGDLDQLRLSQKEYSVASVLKTIRAVFNQMNQVARLQRKEQLAIELELVGRQQQKLVEEVQPPENGNKKREQTKEQGCVGDLAYCLSGTSELAIAWMLRDVVFNKNDLPLKFVAKSRCYRPEVAKGAMSHGLYRMHEFNKVELFVVTEGSCSASDAAHWEILNFQTAFFEDLGLHARVLDMPASDLGSPAYRKYDIEAWLPGRNNYGEVSSASNCTDYQARRLNIRYKSDDETLRYVHTCNGTACAAGRTLLALFETYQVPKWRLRALPEELTQLLPRTRVQPPAISTFKSL